MLKPKALHINFIHSRKLKTNLPNFRTITPQQIKYGINFGNQCGIYPREAEFLWLCIS